MKTKEKDAEYMVQISESGLPSLVARKLKDRLLFPEKNLTYHDRAESRSSL